jgi:hypothetical protein
MSAGGRGTTGAVGDTSGGTQTANEGWWIDCDSVRGWSAAGAGRCSGSTRPRYCDRIVRRSRQTNISKTDDVQAQKSLPGPELVSLSVMDVKLLVVAACPNEAPAWALLRRALDESNLEHVDISTEVITDAVGATRIHFLGSPSFSVNGVDLFLPILSASRESPAGSTRPTRAWPACRIWRK